MSTEMDRVPRDVCFVTYQVGHIVTLWELPDECADVARRCGWSVLIRDSEMPVKAIEPHQSNPRRAWTASEESDRQEPTA